MDPWLKVIWLPCSVHVLKSCVSALHSSDPDGTRNFRLGGPEKQAFGWKIICDTYERDLTRSKMGDIRHVPELKKNYVKRDSWTKMRVAAATAIIVSFMLHLLIGCEGIVYFSMCG